MKMNNKNFVPLQPNSTTMKKTFCFPILLFALLLGLFASCERYDTAYISIMQDSYNDTTRMVYYTATVTDNGGCDRCIEAGYCYSYVDTLPSHTRFYSTVVPVIYDSLMTFTDSTQYLTFSWERHVPFIESADAGTLGDASDTLLYFFRSYVTTNAGTFYSKVDTVKVSRSF